MSSGVLKLAEEVGKDIAGLQGSFYGGMGSPEGGRDRGELMKVVGDSE